MAPATQIVMRVTDFTLPGGVLTDDRFERRDYTLPPQRGRPLVLAFYPGDDTSVCTKQLRSYSSGLEQFQNQDAEAWGISPQDVDSHDRFARKYGLRMPLLADTDRRFARAFGIAAPGIGVRRAVFLVGSDGTLHWKHVALIGATFQPLATSTRHPAGMTTT
ncbi:peroxiredoxin [Streptomyces lydicus]|uniref:peroxiredoxin n=1 Tax=Streptomyces lydicus TaxID=47763 RepID=UPI0010129C7A|nr:redoxin domain-containing protein [Streptomyces lydicus]MCZ1006912.1 redoxin domain-containing protein [Streptomyces lydicus]